MILHTRIKHAEWHKFLNGFHSGIALTEGDLKKGKSGFYLQTEKKQIPVTVKEDLGEDGYYLITITTGKGKGWHGDSPGHREARLKAEGKGAINEPIKTKSGHFNIEEDRMGNITLSHSESKKDAYFQAEADKEAIYELLKKGEKEDLESGYGVEIPDTEPRASVLSELFEASAGEDVSIESQNPKEFIPPIDKENKRFLTQVNSADRVGMLVTNPRVLFTIYIDEEEHPEIYGGFDNPSSDVYAYLVGRAIGRSPPEDYYKQHSVHVKAEYVNDKGEYRTATFKVTGRNTVEKIGGNG